MANNNHLAPKCSAGQVYIPLLLFCQNLDQIGPVVQEKTQKNEIFRYGEREVLAITVLIQKSETVLFTEVEVCDVSNSCGK